MPDSALILFAQPTTAAKARKFGGAPQIHYPTYDRQMARIAPQFNTLQHALLQGNLHITDNATGVDPEYTLVFETIGDPCNFYKAVQKLKEQYPNIEWILELSGQCPSTDDFYVVNNSDVRDDDKQLATKVFCIMTNQQALSEILSLWNHYNQDQNYKFKSGYAGFKHLFNQLYSVHRWGIQERLEDTGVLTVWQYDLQEAGRESVRTKIELFFRSASNKRDAAELRICNIIMEAGGNIISTSVIPEIEYHGILAEIPREYAQRIVDREEVSLVVADEIMFFKTASQSISIGICDATEEIEQIATPERIFNEPIVALFDGMPQENHPLLQSLISVDDPDALANTYPVDERVHGTSMASLILRGENMGNINSDIHKLYIRPIMKSKKDYRGHVDEYIPDDFLLVDKIHECVRRLFEPSAGNVAPTVRIINLSIGISYREYFTLISPLARLLDWLSYKYRVLFIVSAGNHADNIDLGMEYRDYTNLSEADKNNFVIKYLSNNVRNLRLLSPAESMNALTVGSMFADNNPASPIANMTELCSTFMPAVYGSFGRGVNNSVKPDVLYNGGNSHIKEYMACRNCAEWRYSVTRAPGIKSAYPTTTRQGASLTGYSIGTSNSAALISNKAAECYEVLDKLFVTEEGYNIPYSHASVLIKAMLAHGASWGELKDLFKDQLGLGGNQANNELHKYLGYGSTDVERVKEYTQNKICLVGYGDIQQNNAFEYTIPLPFDFHAQKYKRKLTVTLAYLSPIHPSSMKYREKQVWFDLIDPKKVVGNRSEYDYHAVQRGTLQHEILESESTVVWDENDSIVIKVSCRGDASESNPDTQIPYALFATFEMAPEHNIDVYQKISSKVRVTTTVANTTE